jgi:hypothetical protein
MNRPAPRDRPAPERTRGTGGPVTIIPLAECLHLPLSEVGAKAKHLAAALAAGHSVPPGLVLPCQVLAGGVTQAVIDAAWKGAQ